MFDSVLRALGLVKNSTAEVADPNLSVSVDTARLRTIAQQFHSRKERQYLDSLPNQVELAQRAQTIADEIISTIPNRLETNAQKHGWDFASIELIPYFSRFTPAEHQARIQAAPLISKWCSENRLNATVLAGPIERDGDHQIEDIHIVVSF